MVDHLDLNVGPVMYVMDITFLSFRKYENGTFSLLSEGYKCDG